MTYFPAVPLGVKAELLISGVWTDITSLVYVRDSVVITGGRVDWGDTVQPATAKLTVNNRDGRFSPNYAGGLYYPYLQRNTQLRISVTATSSTGNSYSGYRFWGTVSKWPPLSDLSGRDVYVQITASGPLRQVSMGGGKGSALARYYQSLGGLYAPVAYWTCEEDPDSSIVGAGIDGGVNMTVTGEPLFKAISDFNGSAPIAILNKSVWDGLTGSVYYSGDDVYATPGTYQWQCPVSSVDAVAVGGGGGGFSSGSGGGGAGGAEEAEEATLAVTPGNSYTVVVGAAGGPGAAGGDSTFAGDSVTVRAHGGPGATGSGSTAGGTGSSNTAHHDGGGGSAAVSSGGSTTQVLTGSGNWTCPAGVTSVQVEGWAAGAGGAGGGLAGGANSGGEAGGGGAYAKLNAYTVVPGHSYAYSAAGFANGGAPNSLGSNGGDTWWVSTSACLAKGGKAATLSSVGLGGASASCVGDVTHSGGNGGSASSTGASGGGGAGGSTGAGSAGTSVTGSTGGAGGAGNDGGGSGGAGGGANVSGSQGGAPGGGGGGGGGGSSAGSGALGRLGRITLTYTTTSLSGGGGGASGGTAAAGTTATTTSGAAAVTGGGPGGNGGVGTASGSVPVSGPGGGGGGSAGGTAGAGFAGQVSLIYTPPSAPTNNVLRFIMLVPKHGGNNGAVLVRGLTGGTIAKLDVVYQAGGKILLKGYSSAPALLFTSSALTVGDGQTVMVSAELVNSGSSVAYTLTAIIPGATSVIGTITGTQATASIGNVTEVLAGPSGDVTKTAIGHISVQYALIPLTQVSAALNGHHSEMSVDRLIRLCGEQALGNLVLYSEGADHWGFEPGIQSWTTANAYAARSAGTAPGWPSEGSFSLRIIAGFLQGQNSDFEGGTGTWTNTGGDTIAGTSAQAYDGTSSMSMTSLAAGNMSAAHCLAANILTQGMPCAAGDTISCYVQSRAATAARTCQVGAQFYTSAGAAISVLLATGTADVTTGWTKIAGTVTAPATAAFCRLWFQANSTAAAGEVHYIDDAQMADATTGAQWYASSPAGTSGQPVQPGDIVSAAIDLYTPAALGAVKANIDWYTGAGAYLSVTSGTAQATSAGQVLTMLVSGAAPATAAYFRVTALDNETIAAGSVMYADNIRISPQMGAQTRKEFRSFLEEIKELEQGMLKEARSLLGLGYRTRISLISQSPAVTLDYSLAQLSQVPLPVIDDRLIRNDITVKRHKGSSVQVTLDSGTMSVLEPPNGAGRYKKQITAVANDDKQLLALASHLLTLGTAADERYPVISVALHRTEVAALMSVLAGAETGDMISIINMPFWMPSPIAKQLIIGYTETLGNADGMYTWDIDFNCVPESPWEISGTSIRRW